MYSGFVISYCCLLFIFWIMFGCLCISNPHKRSELMGAFKGMLIATVIAFLLVVSITVMENMGLKV